MKNLFSTILILAFFINANCLFANSNANIKNKTITLKNSANLFLDNYYTESYNFGKSIETKANSQSIIVSEIINKKSGLINGYIAVNKENNELLYFVDFLRNTQEIKAIDFKNNITDIINLKKDDKFNKFIKIDIIKEIEKVNNNPELANRRFWGTECGVSWTVPTGECYKSCCYYVFWLENGCDVVGC